MQQWKIGKVTVTKIVECELDHGFDFLIKEATPEAVLPIEWLRPHFVTNAGKLILSFHALVVETPARKILVDTCVGNNKPRAVVPFFDMMRLPFLNSLTLSGYPPEQIDTVVCTHLHIDHVGWNTMLVDDKWVPTFPKARYLMGRHEYNHWKREIDTMPVGDAHADLTRAVFSDSIDPVFDAGLVDLVETDHRICDEVYMVPTLGHTPGHVSIHIESEGESAMITGDMAHHPCQLAHTNWATSFDSDPVQSSKTRDAVFAARAEDGMLVIGTHWAGVTAGHVVRDGPAFKLVY